MTAVWARELPYFGIAELASNDGTICMDARFAAALPDLRRRWARPLNPTSVCRTPSHNEAVGGHPRSLHLTRNPVHPTQGTMAADIYWQDWREQDQIRFARMAYRHGWSVGLNPTFVHIDLREAIGLYKTVFTYDSWSGFPRDEVL